MEKVCSVNMFVGILRLKQKSIVTVTGGDE